MNTAYLDYLTTDMFGVFDARKPENREQFWAFLAATQPEQLEQLRTLNEALVLDLHAEAFRKHKIWQALQRLIGNSDELRATQGDFVLTN